jgi:hypothetical protein
MARQFQQWQVINYDNRTHTCILRLVRVDQAPGDCCTAGSVPMAEVTDNATGLIWRRCIEGLTFSAATLAPPALCRAGFSPCPHRATATGVAWRA